MKMLKFTRSIINDALDKVSITIPSRAIIPCSEGVNIVVGDGKATLSTSMDGSANTEVTVPVESKEDANINIDFKDFQNYVRSTKEETIKIQIAANNIKIGSGREELIVSLIGEPPPGNCEGVVCKYGITEYDIDCLHHRVAPFTSTDLTDEGISGILFEGNGKKIRAISTNRHILSIYDMDIKDFKGKAIVPREYLKALNHLSGHEVTIGFSENDAMIESASARHKTSVYDYKFPNYEGVIPKEFDKIANFDLSNLLGIVRKASLFSGAVPVMAFDLSKGKAVLSCSDVDLGRQYSTDIDCDYSGDDIRIGFNINQISKILSGLNGDSVRFEFNEPNTLVKVTDHEKSGQISIVPVMLGNAT